MTLPLGGVFRRNSTDTLGILFAYAMMKLCCGVFPQCEALGQCVWDMGARLAFGKHHALLPDRSSHSCLQVLMLMSRAGSMSGMLISLLHTICCASRMTFHSRACEFFQACRYMPKWLQMQVTAHPSLNLHSTSTDGCNFNEEHVMQSTHCALKQVSVAGVRRDLDLRTTGKSFLPAHWANTHAYASQLFSHCYMKKNGMSMSEERLRARHAHRRGDDFLHPDSKQRRTWYTTESSGSFRAGLGLIFPFCATSRKTTALAMAWSWNAAADDACSTRKTQMKA